MKRKRENQLKKNHIQKDTKRDFWKWSESTIIYNILHGIEIPKEPMTAKDIKQYNKIIKENTNRNNNTIEYTLQKKVELFKPLSNTNKEMLWYIDFKVLESDYVKAYSQELLNLLLHHTPFYDDMFKNQPELELFKEYLYKKNYKEIQQNKDISITRFQQLYNKFKIKENDIDKLKISSIIKKRYNVENYIENLLFAEYMSKILWRWNSQTIIINNTSYTLYVSSIEKDIYHGADMFLEDESWKTIWIDITLYKQTISWKNPVKPTHFNSSIIINYTKYRKDFEHFAQEYKNYILNKWTLPQWYLQYTAQQVYKFEQRIGDIINLWNNTPSSLDQHTDNNV